MFDLLIAGIFFFHFILDPIVQIAVDNSRNILYTRSEKGVIQVRLIFCQHIKAEEHPYF